jgi:hypothetical protein
LSIYQSQREAWPYQRVAASAGGKKRPKLPEILRAIIRYAVLLIVIELTGMAIIMHLASRNDRAADQRGRANQLAAGQAGK